MGLKEMIKKTFNNDEKIILERYNASKFAFIVSITLFFINFYFVGAKFYSDFFNSIIGITYIILLLSLLFYIYFFVKKSLAGKFPNYFLTITVTILFFILILFILPLLVKGGIVGIFNFIKLYS